MASDRKRPGEPLSVVSKRAVQTRPFAGPTPSILYGLDRRGAAATARVSERVRPASSTSQTGNTASEARNANAMNAARNGEPLVPEPALNAEIVASHLGAQTRDSESQLAANSSIAADQTAESVSSSSIEDTTEAASNRPLVEPPVGPLVEPFVEPLVEPLANVATAEPSETPNPGSETARPSHNPTIEDVPDAQASGSYTAQRTPSTEAGPSESLNAQASANRQAEQDGPRTSASGRAGAGTGAGRPTRLRPSQDPDVQYGFTAEMYIVKHLYAYRMVLSPLQESAVYVETRAGTRNVQLEDATIVGMQPLPENPRYFEWYAIKESPPQLLIRKPELYAARRLSDGSIECVNLTEVRRQEIAARQQTQERALRAAAAEREAAAQRAARIEHNKRENAREAAEIRELQNAVIPPQFRMTVPYRSIYAPIRGFREVNFTHDGTGIHDSSDGNVSDGYSNAEDSDEDSDEEDYDEEDYDEEEDEEDSDDFYDDDDDDDMDGDEEDEDEEDDNDNDDYNYNYYVEEARRRGLYVRELTPEDTLRFAVRVPT